MIDALISGRLFGAAVSRTSRTGNTFATAKVRVTAADGQSTFVNVIAFSKTAAESLLALAADDSVALSGELKVGLYQAKDGTHRPSLDLVAHAVLTSYHVRRKREAVAEARTPGASTELPDRSEHAFNDSLDGVGQ